MAAPAETVLRRSTGGSDGAIPAYRSGALYGTTYNGGRAGNAGGGYGKVFKLTPPAMGQTVW